MPLRELFDRNVEWAEGKTRDDPHFFRRMAEQQSPRYLWIGCSDSRVTANDVLGLEPGSVFVQRNIANIVHTSDMNILSVLEYGIDTLGIEHIIVCGHYGCGGVERALGSDRSALVDHWLQPIVMLTSTEDGPLSWIAGAYYYVENIENNRRIVLGPAFPYLLAGNNAAIFYPTYAGEAGRTESTIESSSWALFGSLTYDISADLHLSGGLRYTDEQKDFSYIQYYTQQYLAGPGPSVIPNFAVNIPRRNESYSDGQFTGDLSISYDISDDQMIFARYSRGYKAGGFQTDVISPPFNPAADFGFDPENVDNYELGYKSFWFNRRLELNLAAFHMDWSDKQEQVFTGVSFIIDNAASAVSEGLELEFTARPMEGLTLDGNVAYLDAHYEEFAGSPGAVGRPIPNQPEYSGSLGAQYVTSLSMGMELFTRADMIYRDNSFVNVTNNLQNEGATTYNARIGVQSPDDRWGVYLWGRNLTDEIAISQGSTFPFPFAQITTRAPGFGRTYGVELRANF